MERHSTNLEQEIVSLYGVKASRLHQRYDGTFPELKLCRQCKILRAEIAYRLQVRFYGHSLAPDTEQLLLRAAGDTARLHGDGQPPKAGTRLLREWKGTIYEVILREDGQIEYAGRFWRSLSAVARDITGTNWNGKLFFGLK